MEKMSDNTPNTYSIKNDEWKEKIKLLKAHNPKITNPEIIGKEINEGRMMYKQIIHWNDQQQIHRINE